MEISYIIDNKEKKRYIKEAGCAQYSFYQINKER